MNKHREKIEDIVDDLDSQYYAIRCYREELNYRRERTVNLDDSDELAMSILELDETLHTLERLIGCLEDAHLLLKDYQEEFDKCENKPRF